MVPTADLHVLPSFSVLCQSMNFVRKGGFSGLISFAAYFPSTRSGFTMCWVVQNVFRNRVPVEDNGPGI